MRTEVIFFRPPEEGWPPEDEWRAFEELCVSYCRLALAGLLPPPSPESERLLAVIEAARKG